MLNCLLHFLHILPHYDKTIRMHGQGEVGPKPPQPPYKLKIKLTKSQGCLPAEEPARAHGFNAALA